MNEEQAFSALRQRMLGLDKLRYQDLYVPLVDSVDMKFAPDEARALIKEIADSVWQDPEWTPKILEEPEVWGVEDLGADGVALRLVVKTAPLAQWAVSRELRSRIKKVFDERGFEIPYKQHTIWLRNEEPKKATASS